VDVDYGGSRSLPCWEELEERPHNPVTTGTGMTTVQWKLLVTDASMDKDESRISFSMTQYALGQYSKPARVAGLFLCFDGHEADNDKRVEMKI
jgi:hypothetical protein